MKTKNKSKAHGHYRSWNEPPAERRKWHRVPPVEGTLAMVEGRPYRVLDVSRGGLAIYDYGNHSVPDVTIVSLHAADRGISLDTLHCRKVSDNRVVSYSTHSAEVVNRVSFEIIDADPDLEARLELFISQS